MTKSSSMPLKASKLIFNCIYLQGVCYDVLSSDLVWSLYGFMKNLPDKNSTVDSFLDYSIAWYHAELIKHLKLFGGISKWVFESEI